MAIETAELTDEQVRENVRSWLREHLPSEWIEAVESGNDQVLRRGASPAGFAGFGTGSGGGGGFGGGAAGGFGLNTLEFLDALAESGYGCPTWPVGACGLGLSATQAQVVNAELTRYRAPRSFNIIGIGMGGPTLIQWGTEEQKQRLLRPLVSGREIWCQLFSEPGHGSDVAGLSTRAVRSGDEWIVNGQKCWTTFAHMAKWGMLVARTDPDVPKHQGLTYFILDLKAPGVTVRPLRQITGDSEFNEVFFDDVRIPDSMRVGREGDGWQVATTTLMNERVALGAGTAAAMPRSLGRGTVDQILDRYKPIADHAVRDRAIRLWIESAILRLTNARATMVRKSGAQPGPEGSIGKLAQAELNQRIQVLEMELRGAKGLAWEGSDPATRAFLRSRANTIEGGTSEIMRNILGERVLGLPRDPDVSRDVPWKDVPRSMPAPRG